MRLLFLFCAVLAWIATMALCFEEGYHHGKSVADVWYRDNGRTYKGIYFGPGVCEFESQGLPYVEFHVCKPGDGDFNIDTITQESHKVHP